MRLSPAALLALALLAPAAHAQTVINFEDLLSAYPAGPYSLSNSAYADFYADRGMTMSATELIYFSPGVDGGDPANFGINGTNGPSFISLFHPNPGGTLVFSFDTSVNLSIDLITSDFIPGDVPVNFLGLRDGKIVFNTNSVVPGAAIGDPDGRGTTFTFDAIDQIQITTTNNNFRGLAFDNLVFDSAACNPADFNQDGVLDFFDIVIFLNHFNLGCR